MNSLWLAGAVALALVVFEVAVRAWRIQLLLPKGQRPTFWRAVVVNAYGDAASAVTPARLGGDPARFVGFRLSGVDSAAAVVALGVELIIDWVVLVAASLLLAAAFGGEALRGVRDLLQGLTSSAALPWLLGVSALVIASGYAAHRYRTRHPGALEQPLRAAWGYARSMSPGVLFGCGMLTSLSMIARVAILPILLLAVHPDVNLAGAVLGSFALIYGQLVLPTPSGVGGVELGFVVGLSPTLSGAEIARLLVMWRVYTTVLPAALGVVAFVWALLRGRRQPAPAGEQS